MKNRIPYAVLSLLVLAAGAWWSSREIDPPGLSAWREGIRLEFADVPQSLGIVHDWLFIEEVPIPTSQSKMLDLNAQISRRYQLLRETPTTQVTIFVAHTNDARAMAGHHPPNCYPSSGWIRYPELDREIFSELPDGSELAMRYYVFGRGDGPTGVQVVNGFILPGGSMVSTLAEASSVMKDASESRLGLVQFQFLFSGSLSPDRVRILAQDLAESLVVRLVRPMKQTDPGAVTESSRGAA